MSVKYTVGQGNGTRKSERTRQKTLILIFICIKVGVFFFARLLQDKFNLHSLEHQT